MRITGEVQTPHQDDFWLEDGYQLEKILSGLTYTTNVCLTPQGDLFVLEAGFSYPYVFLTPRLSRVLSNGDTQVITEDLNGPAIGLFWLEDAFLVTHRGFLSRISLDGRREDLVTDLPAFGDHHTNHIHVHEGKIYFGQGSATNAGFVGPDNMIPFGWLKGHPEFCEVPARDVTLSGLSLESRGAVNPFGSEMTGPYLPFGQAAEPGQVIKGRVKSTGVIYRCNLDGSNLEVFAWGLRNPYSLARAADGRLFCLDQGADVRGSRPLKSLDTIWEIKEDAWFGFPEFLGGRPISELAREQKWDGNTGSLFIDHPNVETPFAQVPEAHAAAVQFEFSTSDVFGYQGDAFIACYGSGAPLTTGGKLIKTPQGVRRFDLVTKSFHEFYRNENLGFGGHGPERPTAVRFSPDGSEMYIADYGVFGTPKTGAIWRVTKT